MGPRHRGVAKFQATPGRSLSVVRPRVAVMAASAGRGLPTGTVGLEANDHQGRDQEVGRQVQPGPSHVVTGLSSPRWRPSKQRRWLLPRSPRLHDPLD